MTVNVTMLISSIPENYPSDDRTHRYEDGPDVAYTYMLHGSGALVVQKRSEGVHDTEVVYGPSAWESVQGDAGSGR
ncbi:hypothetical protein [Streptomyces sp. NPDC005548]|uniref:hypothetical protein n=1 Tax=Streptomyces sp. NPDC005548 TaxID=3364724 RepID=UPI003673C792